jgi:hypothetical protein
VPQERVGRGGTSSLGAGTEAAAAGVASLRDLPSQFMSKLGTIESHMVALPKLLQVSDTVAFWLAVVGRRTVCNLALTAGKCVTLE